MIATVHLSADKTSFRETEDVILRVLIKNPGKSPIKILKWFTPFGGIERSLFKVFLNGSQVPYIGRMVKRAAPIEQDYINLKADESIADDVKLSDYYVLSTTGACDVVYDVFSPQLYLGKEVVEENYGRLSSNPLSIFIMRHTIPAA